MKKEFKATFIGGTSRKFYTLRLEDVTLIRQWGRIGSLGQTKKENFYSEELACIEFEDLKNKKLAKGYKEVDEGRDEKYDGVTMEDVASSFMGVLKAGSGLIKMKRYAESEEKSKFKVGDKVIIKGDSLGACHHFSRGDIGIVKEIDGIKSVKVDVGGRDRWVGLKDLEIYDESCDY